MGAKWPTGCFFGKLFSCSPPPRQILKHIAGVYRIIYRRYIVVYIQNKTHSNDLLPVTSESIFYTPVKMPNPNVQYRIHLISPLHTRKIIFTHSCCSHLPSNYSISISIIASLNTTVVIVVFYSFIFWSYRTAGFDGRRDCLWWFLNKKGIRSNDYTYIGSNKR